MYDEDTMIHDSELNNVSDIGDYEMDMSEDDDDDIDDDIDDDE